MDDQEASYWSYWVGAAALVLVLAAVAWLFVSTSAGTTDANVQAPVTVQQVSGTRPAHHQPRDRAQRCVDAAAGRGVSGCVAETSAPSAPPTPSERRVHRSTLRAVVDVNAVASNVAIGSAPAASPVTPTTPPSTPPPSTPPPAAPARAPVPHHGPVPGGNTSPPHTGPRP
jgi:hypothetical protein